MKAMRMKTCHFLLYGATGWGNTSQFWFFDAPRLILWMAVLAVLVAVAYYAIEKIRPKSVQKEPEDRRWLVKIGELRSQGEVSDEEFRTIKTSLEMEHREELNDNGNEG
jgi:uncharacterized membrane protein